MHEVDAAVGLERAHVQVAPQLADVVDADLVADRLEDVQVRMRAPLDPVAVADQLAGERDRGAPLADAGRPVEEVRVRGPFGERCAQQPLRLGLLRKALEDVHGSPLRSLPAARSPSTVVMRSGNISASARYASSTAR